MMWFFLQKDISQEFFLLFTVFDENLSWYLNQNIETYDTNESELENMEFWESNKMHGIYTDTHTPWFCLPRICFIFSLPF